MSMDPITTFVFSGVIVFPLLSISRTYDKVHPFFGLGKITRRDGISLGRKSIFPSKMPVIPADSARKSRSYCWTPHVKALKCISN